MLDAATLSNAITYETSHKRLTGIDYLRTAIIVLVVAHHSANAYATLSHFDFQNYLHSSSAIVDRHRWIGFDVLEIIDHVFFMALMFMLSGFFVWQSLLRHGPAGFLRHRLLRLGVPYLFGLLVLMPLAHYPSFLFSGGAPGLGAYWRQILMVGPRPNGPIWFLGVLLMFDVAAAAMHRFGLDWSRGPAEWVDRHAGRPVSMFAALLLATMAAYLPLLLRFGSARWLMIGPVPLQANRVLLYALYFGAGIVVGRGGRRLLSPTGALARSWPRWVGVAVLSSGALLAWTFGLLRAPLLPARVVEGVLFALTCSAIGYALLALFLRVVRRHFVVLDRLTADSYGIFMVHYIPVVWLQYALLPADLPAVAKAPLVMVGALAISWAVVALARRLPAVRAVL